MFGKILNIYIYIYIQYLIMIQLYTGSQYNCSSVLTFIIVCLDERALDEVFFSEKSTQQQDMSKNSGGCLHLQESHMAYGFNMLPYKDKS